VLGARCGFCVNNDQKFVASQILKHIHGLDVSLSSLFDLSKSTSQVSLPTPADVDDGDILTSVNNHY
jgi:hypothetical protein